MTRRDPVESARLAHAKASERLAYVENKTVEMAESVRKKRWPIERAARVAAIQALADYETAKLAAVGITPMRTIIALYLPGAFNRRWVVSITRNGWPALLPVTAKNRINKARNPQHFYDRQLKHAKITNDILEVEE